MAWTVTKTWNVGDPATAADMNTYVRDNVSFLYGDAAPVAVALGADFEAVAGFPLNVERHGNLCLLTGAAEAAVNAPAGAAIGSVGTGYAPTRTMTWLGFVVGVAVVQLAIAPSGAITSQSAIAAGGSIVVTGTYSLL